MPLKMGGSNKSLVFGLNFIMMILTFFGPIFLHVLQVSLRNLRNVAKEIKNLKSSFMFYFVLFMNISSNQNQLNTYCSINVFESSNNCFNNCIK